MIDHAMENTENTCRLCLNETSDALEILWEGCDVLDKLSTCISHYISLREDLPRKICHLCVQTVHNIYSFYQQITQNEHMLQQRFTKCQRITNHPDPDSIDVDNGSNCHDNELNLSESFKSDDEPAFVDMKVKTEIDKINDSLTNNIISDSVNVTNNKKTNDIEVINGSTKIETVNSNNIRTTNDNRKDYIDDSHRAQPVYEPGDDIPLSILKENKTKVTNNIDNITKKFTCLTCFEEFKNQLELLKHYQHVELEKYNKNNEVLISETKPVKYKTLTETDGSVTYKCERCYKKYKHKKCIDRHVKSHIDKRPYLCKLCGKTYQTASIIVAHGKMHSGEMYTCAYRCGYQSVHKHVVVDHEKRHRKEYKYKCETCGKGFQVRTWYQQHQNIHNDVRPFRCDQCHKTFHLHKYLMVHKSNVHPQSSGRKPWVCQHCGMPCDAKNSLNLHLKQAHGITTTKPTLCDVCGKVVRDTHQLRHHKRAVHLKIKPYSCSFCDKSFQKKYTLKVHEQTHGGKRYLCNMCDRMFTRNDTLVRHMKTCHTDCKNKCLKCDKTFSSKLKMAAHQKICTSIIIEDSQTI